jgi:hypothetical protein
MFGGLQHLQSYMDSGNGKVVTTASNPHVPRCSMDTLKAWTDEYPPNEKPMCLHAVRLQLHHPVTEELCQWNVRPLF